MYTIGAKVIYIQSVWSDYTENKVITSGTVTKINTKDATIWLDEHRKPEDCLYAAFAYPDIPESWEYLRAQLALAERQKKENDEFMKKTFEFNNDLQRRGLK